jgi:hypothetical protein
MKEVAKAPGTVLGIYRGRADGGRARQGAATAFAAMVGPTMLAYRGSGMTLQQIADKLTLDRIATARGGKWTPTAVKNILDRLK